MKRLAICALIAALPILSGCVGTVSVHQRVFLRGTTVTVFNDTQNDVRVLVNEKDIATLSPGGHCAMRAGDGLFIFYGYSNQFIVTAQVLGKDRVIRSMGYALTIYHDPYSTRAYSLYVRGDQYGYRIDANY